MCVLAPPAPSCAANAVSVAACSLNYNIYY